MKNMSLSMKMAAIFGLLVLVSGAIAILGITKLGGMNQRLGGIVNISAEKVRLATELNHHLVAISRAEKNIILSKTQEEMDEYADFIAATRDKMKEKREQLRELVDDEGDRQLDKFAETWDKYIEINQEVRRLARLNSNEKAKALSMGQSREEFGKMQRALQNIGKRNEEDFARAKRINDASSLAVAGERVKISARLLRNAVELQRAEKNLILANTQEEMEEFSAAMKAVIDDMNVRFTELEAIVDENGRKDLNAARDSFKNFLKYNKQVEDYTRENGNNRAFTLSGSTARELSDRAQVMMEEIAAKNLEDMQNDVKISDASYATAKYTILLVSIIGILAGILIGIFTLTNVNRTLKGVVEQLDSGSEQVSAASEQVAASGQQIAEGASEQASSIEETSSSIEEMASMTRQNSDNAKQASSIAEEANSSAKDGSKVMNQMSEAMNGIKKSSNETAKIIKVIDEIAFQTNLLALNAAVEAARAGEAGKGFAVVAEEVRNLAQRSAEAAKNTNELIEGAQKNAENGVRVSAELKDILEKVANGSDKLNDIIREVSSASDEQRQGIDQLNTAVSQMDEVVQQNASNAEESSSASEELAAQSQSMRHAVVLLTETVFGKGSGHISEMNIQTAKKKSADKKNKNLDLSKLKKHTAKKEERAVPSKSDDSQTVSALEESDLSDF